MRVDDVWIVRIIDDWMFDSVFGRRWAGGAIRTGVFLASVGCTGDLSVGMVVAPASDCECAFYRRAAVEYACLNLRVDGV